MQTKLNPYINFKNSTSDAMKFYHSVFGGKLTMGTFKEFHASQDAGEDDLIMHPQRETENRITLMASDTPNWMEYRTGTNFSLSLSSDNEVELINYFQKLSEGGVVTQPLTKATWGDTFGMCTDKFGIVWLVNISPVKM